MKFIFDFDVEIIKHMITEIF